MEFRDRIRQYISSNRLLQENDRVLVGVSGGADSVALLLVLKDLGYDCFAVHCNFHLRGEESERDRLFVQNLCYSLKVHLTVKDYDTLQYAAVHGCSIEMAARELRYADFEILRKEYSCRATAVAHHRDDSDETVLINLIRGTGIRGLRGIQPLNGNVIRPLLCVSKNEIVEWLEQQGQNYVTDSTNLQCDYTRNRIRLQLLPLMRQINPDVDDAIFRTSQRISQAFMLYRQAVDAEIDRCLTSVGNGVFRIDTASLCESASPQSVLFEILSRYGFNEYQITLIAGSLDCETGTLFESSDAVLIKDRGCFLLKPDTCRGNRFEIAFRVSDSETVSLPDGRFLVVGTAAAGTPIEKNPSVALLDAGRLADKLTIRLWRQGDSFVPFGMKGQKLLSDFMTDCKMSRFDKESQLVVCSGEDIVWVVGRRIDNRYRIDGHTSQIVRLSLK